MAKKKSAILEVPQCQQRNGHDCGPAVARSILWYYDRPVVALERMLGTTPRDGTHPSRLAWLFVASGLRADMISGMTTKVLKGWLAHGIPVVVPMQCEKEWRWVIVLGFEDKQVRLMDPNGGYRDMDVADFESAWHNKTADGVKLSRFGIAVYRG